MVCKYFMADFFREIAAEFGASDAQKQCGAARQAAGKSPPSVIVAHLSQNGDRFDIVQQSPNIPL
jgi:hypothetical protein